MLASKVKYQQSEQILRWPISGGYLYLYLSGKKCKTMFVFSIVKENKIKFTKFETNLPISYITNKFWNTSE